MSGDGWGGGWGDLSSTEGWAAPESGEHEDAAPWPVAAPEQGAPAAAPCAGEPEDNDSDAGVGNLATPETLARLASSASDADEEVAAAPDEQSPGQQEARPAHDSGWGWSSDPAPDSGASADAGSGAAALSAAQAAGPDPSAGFGTPQEAPVPAWGASLLAEAETARSGGAAAAASGAGEAAAAAPDLHAPAPAALLPQASAVSLPSDRDGWEGPSVAAAGELHAALRDAASRSRVKFNDAAFPPDASSLGDLRPIAEEGVPDLPPPRVEWLRARAVGREDAADASRSGGWTVAGAGAGAAPGFPVQGALGDCYIISALAVALSARRFAAGLSPGLVEASLRFGIARCRLCIGGAWSDVITDDFLPCRPGSHDPVFASARGAQLWPAYVEKALAKCFGSYGALAGGRTNEALCWLTGAPLTCVDPVLNRTAEEADVAGVAELVASNAARYGASATLPPDAHLLPVSPGSDDDTFWDRLCRYAANGYLMGASCGASGPVSDLSAWAAAGLVFNHAYSVLGVRQLAGGQRLVRLRNPWAGSESTLAWGPRWPGWTAELRAELGEGPAGDAGPAHGRFWIALSDFRRLFNGLDVCEVRPGWRVTRSVALAPSSAEGLQGTGYFPAFEITVPSGATGEDAGAGAGDIAKTMFERARTMAVRRQLLAALPEDEGIRDAGVFLWKMLDGPAVTYLLENRTRRRTVTVQTTISNGKNIILSRAATAEAAVQFAGKRSSKSTAKFTDTLLPLTRMVVVSCSPQRTPSVNRSVDTSVSWMDPPPEVRVGSGTTPASHDPAAVGFHAPIQCEA